MKVLVDADKLAELIIAADFLKTFRKESRDYELALEHINNVFEAYFSKINHAEEGQEIVFPTYPGPYRNGL
jgi:hypothetical protein